MKKVTSQRRAIMRVFRENDRPLRVEEILDEGRKAMPTLSPATVYRNLKTLVGEEWLVKVHHPELGTLYERQGKGHHHFFHCRVCNRIQDLPGCVLAEDCPRAPGFLVEGHEVYLYGVCGDCAR